MRVLIVEDDLHKLHELDEFVSAAMPGSQVVQRRSYQSGLEEIMTNGADLLILDMSMPTYDVSPTETGGRSRPYAGREVLHEMQRRSRAIPVIIVTGFQSFGAGAEKTSLDELAASLARDFPEMYRTTIYYHPSEEKWKRDFTAALGIALSTKARDK